MLLKQLVDYAERLERSTEIKTLPRGYQNVGIRWIIELDRDGTLIGRPQRTTSGEKDRAKQYAAPSLVRTVGVKAKLLADNGEYTLGISREDSDAAKVQKRHEAYLDALKACQETTGSEEVQVITTFLETLSVDALNLPDDFDPNENITFSVEGTKPIDLPAIQSYWAEGAAVSKKKKALVAECLISGQMGEVMNREPVKIKGIPDGQTSGMNIVSANENVYESYGLKASQIAPILPEYAEKYANALNYLLKNDETHLRVGSSVVYTFWTKQEDLPNLVTVLKDPAEVRNGLAARRGGNAPTFETRAEAGQVKGALKSPWLGEVFTSVKDHKDAFYAASFSASGSRVVVRDHITSTVGQLLENLDNYFDAQKLVDWEGKMGEPFGIYPLAASLYRDANKEMVGSVPVAILAYALKKQPLPYALLDQLVKRNRAERQLTRSRAVLTKMIFVSNQKEDMTGMEKLVRDRPEAAYHLGRLLAALETIQKEAIPNIKAGIVDRFYGSFSTAPASVLGRLMQSSQDHLGKIRKDNYGAYTNAEKRLQEIIGHIEDAPDTLTTKDQALFSLGFYHEKADFWEGIMEKSRAKKAAESEEEQ